MKSLLPLFACSLVLSACVDSSIPKRHDEVRLSSDHTEARFETSGTLQVDAKGKIVAAGIQPVLQNSYTNWPKATFAGKRALDPGRTYRLEFLEAKIAAYGYKKNTCIEDTLVRIKDGEKVIYDASICPLHQTPMTRVVEDGVSGEYYTDHHPDYFDVYRPNHCPEDGKVYLACGSGIRHPAWQCPACYAASERWRESHRIPKE